MLHMKTEKKRKASAPLGAAMPVNQRLTHGQIMVTATDSTSGPLPSAEQFALYVKAQPDAGDRILTLAEKQQAFRHKADNRIITAYNWLSFAGLLANLIVGVSPIIAAVLLALNGYEIAAAVIGGGGVVAFAGTAVFSIVRAMKSGKD